MAKATGIVRRIDDLGRVVIPKEIRRTMRIKEGDPMEIYTNEKGEIIFAKFSPLGEIQRLVDGYLEVLYQFVGQPLLITDRDTVVGAFGIPEREVIGRRVTSQMEQVILTRQNHIVQQHGELKAIEGLFYPILAVFPICTINDCNGAVVALHDPKKSKELKEDVLILATKLMAKQIEDV